MGATPSQGTQSNLYVDLLKRTKKGHEEQSRPHGSYQMNPDCKTNLWSIIDKYKRARADQKELAIAQKSANAAEHFRKFN